jgi:N-acetylglucosamine-6-phosphate deacetylase
MRVALENARVLLDEGFVDDRVVVLDGGRIESIVPVGDARLAAIAREDLHGGLLLPGFIDVQVNGGGGALFNDDPSVATIAAIARAHRRFGTTSLLPTLISDDRRIIERAIDATRDAIAQNIPGVVGVHIEGPCLNEVKKGAHDAEKFRDLDADDVAVLTSLHAGRTLVTLAPEMTSPATIAQLVARGVLVSAGHSNATYAQMQPALAAGVTAFTHLFNAMSPLGSREPGVVGAALSHQESWCGLIVDGHHVDPVVLKLALACKRRDRFLLVTDAMPGVGSAQDHFMLQGRRIEVSEGRCVDENGVLTGSNLDMASAVRNSVSMLGVMLEDAVRMASTWPAQFLGLGDELGRIAAGYRANLVLLDADLQVRNTWIDGVRD